MAACAAMTLEDTGRTVILAMTGIQANIGFPSNRAPTSMSIGGGEGGNHPKNANGRVSPGHVVIAALGKR